MTDLPTRKELHAELNRLSTSQRYDEALDLLASAETERQLDAHELVMKGRLIQLASESCQFPLMDAASAFKEALDLEPESIDARVELAWYFHTIEGDHRRAEALFRQAIASSRSQLTEAARGLAACLEEIESTAAAESFLRALHHAALVAEDLDEQEQGWLDSP